jgi:hypothetical protein
MSIFHRIQWEQWHLVFPIIAFFLIFSVFLLVVYRILRTSNENLDHLSTLPLENEKLSNEPRPQRTR